MASHQMCQIRAKPSTTAQKARKKPVGLLRGSMQLGHRARPGLVDLLPHSDASSSNRRQSPLTAGRMAKFQAGGGDGVDHSSVRPFHDDPP